MPALPRRSTLLFEAGAVHIGTDATNQTIPWVAKVNDDGSTVEYLSLDAKQPVSGQKHQMDCIDCHNRANLLTFGLIRHVAKPEPTIWPIVPHTSAKHTILRTYLDAWFPIMSWKPRVVFLDGFAGPGRYTGGEPGSPIIALESAKTHKAKLSRELVFLFIEQRKDRADHLSEEIDAREYPASFKMEVKCGEFAPTLRAILDELAKSALKLAPTFAMVDPFGFAGIPFDLMKRLLDNPSCELFVSFMVDSFNRWLDHPSTPFVLTSGMRSAPMSPLRSPKKLKIACRR